MSNPYVKTVWVNDSTPAISAANLNKIEQGIFDNNTASSAAINDISEYDSSLAQYIELTPSSTTSNKMIGRDGGELSNGNWNYYTYQVTGKTVKITTQYNKFAPMIVYYNGVPSTSTFLGFFNPQEDDTTILTATNYVFNIPTGATYFIVNYYKNASAPYSVKLLDRSVIKSAVDELENDVDDLKELTTDYSDITLEISEGFFTATVGSSATPTANGNYYCAKVAVHEGETYLVSGTVRAFAYGVTALVVFINEANTSVIGSILGEGAETVTYEDYAFTIPSGCGYIGITGAKKINSTYYDEPTLKKAQPYDFAEMKEEIDELYETVVTDDFNKYTVTIASDEISVKTHADTTWVWKKIAANYLFELCSWTINGVRKQINTDIIGPYHNLTAVNNGNGDRATSSSYIGAPFTGGCHGFNGDQTGTPTAEVISRNIYLDGVLTENNGTYHCNSVTLEFLNGIQATNTCLEAGDGRVVMNERQTFIVDGNKLKVSVRLEPLEEIYVKRYYGMQLAGYSTYYLLGEEYNEIGNVGAINNTVPDIIVGYDSNSQLSMRMEKIGIGDYHLNSTTKKAISSSDKAYFFPIEENTEHWDVGDIQYFVGEYVLDRTFSF